MNKKATRILSRMLQLAGLLTVFVAGGLLLPIYAAPFIYDLLPVQPPKQQLADRLSIRTENRNVNYGESFTITASTPDGQARITNISYSCGFSDVSFGYKTGDGLRDLPCGKRVELPAGGGPHTITSLTRRESAGYVPVTFQISVGEDSYTLSSVIVVAKANTDAQSRLKDSAEVTLSGD